VPCGKGSLQFKLQICPMRVGQVAKEARRRSSHVALTWSGMYDLVGLIFLSWHMALKSLERSRL